MKENLKNLTLQSYLISGSVFGGLIGYVATENIIGTIIGILAGLIFGAVFNKISD